MAVAVVCDEEAFIFIISLFSLTSFSMTEAFFADVVKLENLLLIDVA